MKWLAALAVVAVGSAREGSRFNRAIDLDKLEEDLNMGDEKDEAWGDLEKVKTKSLAGGAPSFRRNAAGRPPFAS